jgi:hypothetical protein
MKTQFVNYEIALKLKELGFNEECFGIYGSCAEEFVIVRDANKLVAISPDNTLAPLHQQVIDWFKEKYDIIIDIAKIYNGTNNYHFALNLEWEYFEGTYYEAREAAILKAIKLIKTI